ncbi:MAG: IS66 family transposase zinc-finger binding domain-containing protein, partial [Acidobacteria bacterium]|nr:IS66 family transposase zinc-finger binding domain-containing protein [Acidobacteriota bacterium]
LGEDISEILEYVPECFRVIRQVRPKLSCRTDPAAYCIHRPSPPVSILPVSGSQKLLVCRFRCRGRTCCHPVQPDRIG